VWRGVPYAQQPVGQRRFAAPAPLLPWTGVRDAVEHGPLPLQSRSLVAGDRNDPKIRDEACLTLTVWSPDVSGSLPVMVWIPGGAFLTVAGQLQHYNGSRLAANGNAKEFANGFLRAARLSPEERKLFAERNQRIVEERADWDRNFPRLLEMYEQLVGAQVFG